MFPLTHAGFAPGSGNPYGFKSQNGLKAVKLFLSRTIVNGKQIGRGYTYVRRSTNSYNPAFQDLTKEDLRCNVGAKPGDNVKTLEVNTGDRVGFKVFNNELIEHTGPSFVYMSKVPYGVAGA
ncbi:uncharacterized protein CTHT_0071950 [Thermochaetoides thermophila DSM 1495]|uniref:lytic cellulose monooxygenase (C4-dehydrogenating) n=1 Tax=Chaetomium thermophilum (strain DSM 1495 / CBS 144.50 / IMI 039719) TaxID=759272 RepID=G0SFS5_CHATD|nr:hypothetical protein CTHT_0071950 [Thermochaetoides thermophila DSM 1495]EGS17840.1 hypothetical protein CTHT_0071950 [Thermochaetoides thermophila DSM 1495]